MLSRLSIIGFLLCLPIALALFSQQITRTVAPPPLPAVERPVKLLGSARNGRKNGDAQAPEQAVPEDYTPRAIKHWGEAVEASDETQAPGGEQPASPASMSQPGAQANRAQAASTAPAPAQAAPTQSKKR